MFEPRQFR
jgi:aminoglycoside phosphotransferase